MKKKRKIEIKTDIDNIKAQKAYSIDELIELGKKSNYVELAEPLFDKNDNKKEQEK